MHITVKQSEQHREHLRHYWSWCYTNGFVASEVADAILVDTEQGTVTINQFVPVCQPGDPDFPELMRDEFNRPLVEVKVFPLVAPVPAWMVTQAGQPLAA